MLALALAATLAVAAPQETLTQADYNAFKRCQGEIFGFYRTGVILFGGTELERHVHDSGGAMTEFLVEVDDMLMRTGVQLDWRGGYAVYQQAHERWTYWHNRRGAEDQYWDASPIEGCDGAIKKVAVFIDSRS